MSKEKSAERLLTISYEELLAEFDKIDASQFDFPVFLHATEEDTALNRKLKLEVLKDKYAMKICLHPQVKDAVTNDSSERKINLVCAIADLLAFSGSMTVAALIVREGLQSLCSPIWTKKT